MPLEIAGINRAPRSKDSGLGSGCIQSSRSSWVFSAALTGCSRFPVPDVLGLQFPDRVFSVSCTGHSRPPAPGASVLGFLCRVFLVSSSLTGCSRFPVPGVLGLQLSDRVFSVPCAGRFRPPNPDQEFSVPRAGRYNSG